MIEIEKITDEQDLMKSFVKDLSEKYDLEYMLEKIRNKEFPIELWNDIAKNEYIGIITPEEYGGGDFKIDDLRVFVGDMARNGLMMLQLASQIIDCDIIANYCNEDQKSKYIPQIFSGTRCSFAMTEPESGESTFDLKAIASKEGDYYKLNGHKTYITGAKESKYMLVVARTMPYKDVKDIDKHLGVSLFFIDTESQGIDMTPQDIGFRATSLREEMLITGDIQYDVHFADVRVPKENLIGEEDEGGRYLYDSFNLSKIMTAAMAIGWGRNVLDRAVEYAKQRAIFEDPIGSYQAIQHPMARAKTDLELANLTNQRAARAYDNGENKREVSIYAEVAKFAASEAAYKACDIAIQTHGGYSFDRDYGIIPFWQPILLTMIAPISNEIILDHFGEYVLDLPKSL